MFISRKWDVPERVTRQWHPWANGPGLGWQAGRRGGWSTHGALGWGDFQESVWVRVLVFLAGGSTKAGSWSGTGMENIGSVASGQAHS